MTWSRLILPIPHRRALPTGPLCSDGFLLKGVGGMTAAAIVKEGMTEVGA